MENSSEESSTIRHKIGIDALSLIDDDESSENTEEIAISNILYITIIKSLTTDREKFIALALDSGFEKVDIALMLNLHPSQVTRDTQKIRIKLRDFKKPSQVSTPKQIKL